MMYKLRNRKKIMEIKRKMKKLITLKMLKMN